MAIVRHITKSPQPESPVLYILREMDKRRWDKALDDYKRKMKGSVNKKSLA